MLKEETLVFTIVDNLDDLAGITLFSPLGWAHKEIITPRATMNYNETHNCKLNQDEIDHEIA